MRSIVVYTGDTCVAEVVKRYTELIKCLGNARGVDVKPVEELARITRYDVEPVQKNIESRYRKHTPLIIKYIEDSSEKAVVDIVGKGRHTAVINDVNVRLIREDLRITLVYLEGCRFEKRVRGSIAVDTRLTLRRRG